MSSRAALEQTLEKLAAPLVQAQGLQLVDLEFHPRSGKALLRVFLDRPGGGITIDEIENFSREFSTLLDVEDPVAQAFTLEVSSPGLTRPLKKPRDWQWARGRLVNVRTRAPVERRQEFLGKLVDVTDEGVALESGGKKIQLTYDQIAKANLEFEMELED